MRALLFAIAATTVVNSGCRSRSCDRAQSYDRCPPPQSAAAPRGVTPASKQDNPVVASPTAPAAVKTAICQNRSVAMPAIKIRYPSTPNILESGL